MLFYCCMRQERGTPCFGILFNSKGGGNGAGSGVDSLGEPEGSRKSSGPTGESRAALALIQTKLSSAKEAFHKLTWHSRCSWGLQRCSSELGSKPVQELACKSPWVHSGWRCKGLACTRSEEPSPLGCSTQACRPCKEPSSCGFRQPSCKWCKELAWYGIPEPCGKRGRCRSW